MLDKEKYTYFIGIDPGVNTGIAVWCPFDKKLRLFTGKIHEAMANIKYYHTSNPGKVFVRLEDARKRRWYGNAGREKLQGAGSVKRDCSIWKDYLEFLKVPFELVAPKNNRTKIDGKVFTAMTGFIGRSSGHARDAALLVYGI